MCSNVLDANKYAVIIGSVYFTLLPFTSQNYALIISFGMWNDDDVDVIRFYNW